MPGPGGQHLVPRFADGGSKRHDRQVNTKDQTFTFYPKPQFSADTPKIQVTKDGAVWFAPRGSLRAPAISVLYPDMDKITSFAAFYVNGPPGYPFKTTASSARRRWHQRRRRYDQRQVVSRLLLRLGAFFEIYDLLMTAYVSPGLILLRSDSPVREGVDVAHQKQARTSSAK